MVHTGEIPAGISVCTDTLLMSPDLQGASVGHISITQNVFTISVFFSFLCNA
jgi:hypothetical protein